MRRFLSLFLCLLVVACAIPATPEDGDLINATKQFRRELFEGGARGEVILSMSDNVSGGGFFSTKYDNVMRFRNIGSGEVFNMTTRRGKNVFDMAMLSVGTYEIENLSLEYTYTTTEQIGNQRIIRTHLVTDDNFQNDKKIRFTVKPGEVVYIGHFYLIKPENVAVGASSETQKNNFKIVDDSSTFTEVQKFLWEEKFGVPFVVRLAKVQK